MSKTQGDLINCFGVFTFMLCMFTAVGATVAEGAAGTHAGAETGMAVDVLADHASAFNDNSREEPQGWRVTLYWENDGSFAKAFDQHDRYYTNGLKLAIAHQPRWADDLMRWLPGHGSFNEANLRTAGGYVLAQEIYTSGDIDLPDPPLDDHPYSGWLYAGVFAQRSDLHTFDALELNIGVIGSNSQADDMQQWVHQWRNMYEPQGWNTQLGNEVGFNLHYQRKWKIRFSDSDKDGRHDADSAVQVELIPHAGFVLGTINRELNAGGTFRVGVLPEDFGPGRLRDISDATRMGLADKLGLYGYVRLNGRVVEHNTFLEGNNYKDSRGVSVEPLVGELSVGVALEWRWLELGYSATWLTDEFKTQDNAHSYGAITMTAKFCF